MLRQLLTLLAVITGLAAPAGMAEARDAHVENVAAQVSQLPAQGVALAAEWPAPLNPGPRDDLSHAQARFVDMTAAVAVRSVVIRVDRARE
jgi:hypothetical protein